MVDLTTLADAAARDPLLGAFVLMATGALVSRLLFKHQPIWRAIVRVVFLILLTLLLLHNGIVPHEPLHSTGRPFHDVIVGTLKIAWWFWAAWFLVALVRSVVVFEHRRRQADPGPPFRSNLSGRDFRHHRVCVRSPCPRLARHFRRHRHRLRPRTSKHVERCVFRPRAQS